MLNPTLLLEIGALDKGDQLRNGKVPCILLTEDTNVGYIRLLAEASGFIPDEYQIWSYNGCSNINIAQALNSFIKDHAPGTSVVVHRDRDYMTDAEVIAYKEKLELVGIKVFVTTGNDTETHFINEHHISNLYAAVSVQKASELIDQCVLECKGKILQKYIDTIYNRRLADSYKGGDKPSAGTISNECTANFNRDSRQYMHGKTVESALRGKLQEEIGTNVDFCKITSHIANPILVAFAAEIWRND